MNFNSPSLDLDQVMKIGCFIFGYSSGNYSSVLLGVVNCEKIRLVSHFLNLLNTDFETC